jgi:hypothetical protein
MRLMSSSFSSTAFNLEARAESTIEKVHIAQRQTLSMLHLSIIETEGEEKGL